MTTLYLFLLMLLHSAFSQECSDEMMRRCRREGLNTIDSSNSRRDINDQCTSLQENFNCVLWQTSMCLDKDDQDDNRDSILRMWRYMQSYCESQGSWYTKACFQREDVKRCESLLPSRGTSTDPSSCRSFSSFRRCVTSIAQIQCTTSDQKSLGTYLMEKGQQRAWNCPRDQNELYPASAPLSDTLSDTSSYGRCSDAARSDIQECRTQFYSAQRESQEHNDSDMRHHITCCAMVHYEECVERGIESYCGGDSRGKTEAKNIVADMRQRFPYQSCEDHTMTECSASTRVVTSLLVCLLLTMTTHFVALRSF